MLVRCLFISVCLKLVYLCLSASLGRRPRAARRRRARVRRPLRDDLVQAGARDEEQRKGGQRRARPHGPQAAATEPLPAQVQRQRGRGHRQQRGPHDPSGALLLVVDPSRRRAPRPSRPGRRRQQPAAPPQRAQPRAGTHRASHRRAHQRGPHRLRGLHRARAHPAAAEPGNARTPTLTPTLTLHLPPPQHTTPRPV
eukprot:scaffold1878_cov64-Phaeocystis_antarctica.AAC.6